MAHAALGSLLHFLRRYHDHAAEPCRCMPTYAATSPRFNGSAECISFLIKKRDRLGRRSIVARLDGVPQRDLMARS
jgi:hypothetical protein